MRLKQIRESKRISQKELANKLGITESAVCHWEAGRYLPTTDKLQQIAKTLGVTIDELLADSEEAQ